MTKASVIIPAYNEEKRIGNTIKQVWPFADEIIVIDDGSKDNTSELAKKHGAIVLTQPENQGYIAAIKHGFKKAIGDIVVTLDADGEFSSKYMPDLIQPIINDKADMVKGIKALFPGYLKES